jgi:hypothetical protein
MERGAERRPERVTSPPPIRDSRMSPYADGATQYPVCRKCSVGALLPLSDYGRDGAPITYKAWVCNNPECGFNIRIDNGEISFGRSVIHSHK